MRTLIIGDLHLQAGLILPWIKNVIIKETIQKVVFIGDYFDQWGQCSNDRLYLSELNELLDFNRYAIANGIEVDWLIGNHDAPYILNKPDVYSSDNREVRMQIQDGLKLLKPKVTTKVGHFQVSHAGLMLDRIYKNIDFTTPAGYLELDHLNQEDGYTSDGYASPLWVRPNTLLSSTSHYKHQIIGHTNTRSVEHLKGNIEVYNVDTFSLNRNLTPIGDGSVLIVNEDDSVNVVVHPHWKLVAFNAARKHYFNTQKVVTK